MPCRILIADDDTFTRTILDAVLTRHGYAVTLAEDGLNAVNLLTEQTFDLVMLDYHMPQLDGVGVARKIRELARHADARPRFIAVTADPDGLEERSHSRDMFDAIVQKPINVECLIEVIEDSVRQLEEAATAGKILDVWRARGLDRAPRGRFAVRPDDAVRRQLERVFDLDRPQNPDCILITGEANAAAVAALRTAGNLYTLPSIDLTGRFGHVADAIFRLHDLATWDEVAMRVREFTSRRRQLRPRFLGASDAADQLLAYVYVSGHDLRPIIDLGEDHGVSYPGLFPTSQLLPLAERLVQAGLLRRLRAPHHTSAGPTGVLLSAPQFTLSDGAVAELTGMTGIDQLDERFPIAS